MKREGFLDVELEGEKEKGSPFDGSLKKIFVRQTT